MIKKYKKIFNSSMLIAVIAVLCFACETDLYETFDEYVDQNKDVVSVARPDTVIVTSGYEKLLFQIAVNSDPKIAKAAVEWNQRVTIEGKDTIVGKSAFLDINRTEFIDEVYEIEIELPGNRYDFNVYLEDAFGTKSNGTIVSGIVFGEEYRQSLPVRGYLDVRAYSPIDAIIYWDTIEDESLLVSSEIRYVDSNGIEQTIAVPNGDIATIIPNAVSEGVFYIKSSYTLTSESTDILETDEKEVDFPVI